MAVAGLNLGIYEGCKLSWLHDCEKPKSISDIKGSALIILENNMLLPHVHYEVNKTDKNHAVLNFIFTGKVQDKNVLVEILDWSFSKTKHAKLIPEFTSVACNDLGEGLDKDWFDVSLYSIKTSENKQESKVITPEASAKPQLYRSKFGLLSANYELESIEAEMSSINPMAYQTLLKRLELTIFETCFSSNQKKCLLLAELAVFLYLDDDPSNVRVRFSRSQAETNFECVKTAVYMDEQQYGYFQVKSTNNNALIDITLFKEGVAEPHQLQLKDN